MKVAAFIFFIFTVTTFPEVLGHGRLMEPPARNAMWRFGYPNPVNYNDNELYCGGFVVHYQKNGGKCGPCGDNYQEKPPRSHEAGGLFANGIIVRRYVTGQVISINADLTTNHKGIMEVSLCPQNDPTAVVDEACFARYPLEVVESPYGKGNQFIIPRDSPKVISYEWKVKLPDDLTCFHCIIRWIYFAGNTWGSCTDGSEGVGCGEQETFINCADVAIYSQTTLIPEDIVDNPWRVYVRSNEVAPYEKKGQGNQLLPPLKPFVIKTQLCRPTQKYQNVTGMGDWCRKNCMKYVPECHPEACECVSECRAIGEFAKKDDADIFCLQYCLNYNYHCPPERCECY